MLFYPVMLLLKDKFSWLSGFSSIVKLFLLDLTQVSRRGSEQTGIFDELLYKCRFVVEKTNAWLDGFKAILVRFETNKIHWKALNLPAFVVILLRQL